MSSRRVTMIALLTTSILAGCVVGPNYQAPNTAMPGKWGAVSDKTTVKPPELAFWWKRFHDPLLDSYISKAIQGNLDVASASARVAEARAAFMQQRGALFPSLNNNASLKETKLAEANSPIGKNPSLNWQGGFDASWEIDLFGGKQRAVEGARYGLDAAQEDLRNTMLVLIGDVALSYAQVRASQEQLSLARRTAKLQRETAKLTRAKVEAGTATLAETSRAEALATTTEAEIPVIEIARAAAVHRLGVLLGVAPAQLADQLEKRGPIPSPKLPIAVGIPADLLKNRPDVRVAERQMAQATAQIGVAEAARYPSINLVGNIASQALTLNEFAKKSTVSWAIGPAIVVPIFQGGQLKAAVEMAEARRDGAAANYQKSVLTAMEDVENAIVSMNQSRVRSLKLASAVSSYRLSYNASRIHYEAGTIDYLNLLDVQRAQYQAESSLIESQLAVTQSYIALNKALGGGWSGDKND